MYTFFVHKLTYFYVYDHIFICMNIYVYLYVCIYAYTNIFYAYTKNFTEHHEDDSMIFDLKWTIKTSDIAFKVLSKGKK